jgi:hypothetical protein
MAAEPRVIKVSFGLASLTGYYLSG